jgi:transcriptional regulator with GAF, ATPase, and Fis domain
MATSIIGRSEAILRVEEDIQCAARTDAKVLLSGESGVGKEVVARLIHERSARRLRPLVTINCAGIPDSLLASELFGHMRGSFTDAHRDRVGLLEQGNRGTLFLDEVGEMSASLQTLMLRFLENGEIQPVGSQQRLSKVDVRVIAATNRVLIDQVGRREFREDLYYRLNVIHIEIPPLRARIDDVPLLMEWFLQQCAVQHRTTAPRLSADARARLLAYNWPGNVREVRNIAERLVVRARSGEITAADLPREVLGGQPAVEAKPRAVAARADIVFDAMTQHGESFWSAVHGPFMARDITRDDLRLMIRRGLTATRGNYKVLVQLFNMPPEDYKRFLNFLRKHQAHLPIHEFRSQSTASLVPRREVMVREHAGMS